MLAAGKLMSCRSVLANQPGLSLVKSGYTELTIPQGVTIVAMNVAPQYVNPTGVTLKITFPKQNALIEININHPGLRREMSSPVVMAARPPEKMTGRIWAALWIGGRDCRTCQNWKR